jgi:hypothetical protein
MLKRKRERQVGGVNGDNVVDWLGANEMGANEMGANEMGANEMGANEMGANEMGANEMDCLEVWCPKDMAFTMQRLILQRYFSEEVAERCTICLDAMVPKMTLYLPCKHAFHYTCWQHLVEQQTYTCPLCRANFSVFLPVVGMETPTATNTTATNTMASDTTVVLTIFAHMDLYDFMLELLWRNYEREAESLEEEAIIR